MLDIVERKIICTKSIVHAVNYKSLADFCNLLDYTGFMKKKSRWLLLLLSIVIALLPLTLLHRLPVLAAPMAAPGATAVPKLDAALIKALAETGPDDMIRVIVHMKGTAVLPPPPAAANKLAQRLVVIENLQQTAVSSQTALRQQLAAWKQTGTVAAYRPFWIINAIAVAGTSDAIRQIAARSDVTAVTLDARQRYFEPLAADHWSLVANNQPLTTSSQPTTSWGVERINAPAVWYGLGIDGSGVTVAIMDTGVDWLHPDLYDNYRGNLGGGVIDHTGNWYAPVNPTATVPFDLHGHGTHVAGTAVGQNGIGVAPGANWIAVSIADEYGFIYESDVHDGFEWLMAPAGDPALAPDLINNSWSGSPFSTDFVTDVNALLSAGIIPVFAAGNSGPEPGSVGSPASYTSTLAVAASDDIDAVAWFSGRGPSPLTEAQTPWIAAPGTAIPSSLPDGDYGELSGTSMATPHVVGAMALLLSANPALTQTALADTMAATAVPIAPPHPNNDSGWGRLDAYAAVATQTPHGVLTGLVHHDGVPLPQATIAITTPTGAAIYLQTDGDGRYQASLQAGSYDLDASLFGYAKYTTNNLTVTPNQTTTRDINLTALPTGAVDGRIVEAGTNNPLTAVITVLNTPITTTADGDGRYTLTLPPDQYELLVEASGHRLGRAAIAPQAGQTITQDFALEPAPTLLLVDSGQWHYGSQITYYQTSLTALDRSYDTWTIRDPYNDVPAAADLMAYDAVIWSSPLDSPGYIGAGEVISDYLDTGGHFLISGQDVGYYDGTGFGTQIWWYHHLGANFMGETAVTTTLTGAEDSLYAGITPTLNAEDSANNQADLDQSLPRVNSLTQPTFVFDDELAGGLQAGLCQPYRISYFGFGLEGVTAVQRGEIISRSLSYFESPLREDGVLWTSDAVDDFAVPGQQLIYTLTLRNLSETMTDTFDVSVSGAEWAVDILTETLTLGSCQSGQTVVTIFVPDDAPKGFEHQAEMTAVSRSNPAASDQLTLHHSIPGYILLVDDDRWYDQQDVYRAMLDAMNLPYDVWDIGADNNKRGSPPQELLNAYDIVLWYTAYDWFMPVTAAENETLTNYLAQGGRLFLTSQDFLYYHRQTPLAQNYLGVIEHREDLTPTVAYGAANPLFGPNLAGPLPFDYTPYQNFSDGVVPGPMSAPFIWTNRGAAAGTATTGGDWRAVFFSFPLEKLPPAARTDMMNGIVGWLGDLGETTFAVDERTGAAGSARTYTITLQNLTAAPANQTAITNTLPVSLTLLPETITGGASYDSGSRQLTWAGELAGGETHLISYQAVPVVGLADGAQVDNELRVYYGRHHLTFTRTAPIWINAPDLSGSTITAVSNAPAVSPQVTYTLQLVNSGLQAADVVTAVLQFSEPITPDLNTLTVSGGIAQWNEDHLDWAGGLAPGETVTITLTLSREISLENHWLPVTAVLHDTVTPPILLYHQLFIPPYAHYLPLIAKTE